MSCKTTVIRALDVALEQRIVRLFDVYCSEESDEALVHLKTGLRKTLEAHNRVMKAVEEANI